MKTATTDLRWMLRRDYPAVVALDWAATSRARLSMAELARLMRLKSVAGYVVEIDGEIVAYSIHELHISRRHLIALAVAPERQRQGIGSRLLRRVARRTDGGIKPLSAIVRESNLPACLFLKANGFRACEVKREWFRNGEDAFVFAREGTK